MIKSDIEYKCTLNQQEYFESINIRNEFHLIQSLKWKLYHLLRKFGIIKGNFDKMSLW